MLCLLMLQRHCKMHLRMLRHDLQVPLGLFQVYLDVPHLDLQVPGETAMLQVRSGHVQVLGETAMLQVRSVLLRVHLEVRAEVQLL